LDVDKEWIVITVAEWGRNGAVQDLGAISNDSACAGKVAGPIAQALRA